MRGFFHYRKKNLGRIRHYTLSIKIALLKLLCYHIFCHIRHSKEHSMPHVAPYSRYPFKTPGGFLAEWLTAQGFGPGQVHQFAININDFDPALLVAGVTAADIFTTPLCRMVLEERVPKADPDFVHFFNGYVARDNELEAPYSLTRGTPCRLIIARNVPSTQDEPPFFGLIQFDQLQHPAVSMLNLSAPAQHTS
jgi:hypothetical protein